MDHQYSSYIWNEESSDTMNKEIIIVPDTESAIDTTLRDLTNAAINICTQLQSDSTTHGNVGSKSAEKAFAEFVGFSLQAMEEPERSTKRNKIFQVLTTPFDQLL
ncbi:hypothetical protein ACS0PU_012399 [Formica fusca]